LPLRVRRSARYSAIDTVCAPATFHEPFVPCVCSWTDLLAPVVGGIDALPGPQAAALAGRSRTTNARDGQSFVLGSEPAVGNVPALDGQTPDGRRAVAFNIDTTAPGGVRVHAVCASP
jgi:hypothetical protein